MPTTSAGITRRDSEGHPNQAGEPSKTSAAANQWDRIAQALRAAEGGRSGTADVELRPGGQLVLVKPGQPPEPLSRLPRSRMAAGNRGPMASDVAFLRQLDPLNVEQWTPLLTDQISGWAFRMTSPFAGLPPFIFFAFRSPSDANAYRIALLDPDMDEAFGHNFHMIETYVGGQRVPVICGPQGKPARDLASVRVHAAKWMAYTSARMVGQNPQFSM
jgi:hypothetical protein